MRYPVSRHIGLVICIVLAAAAAAIQITTSFESGAVGPGQRISVIDGDTLELDDKIIQLYGIDAPELGQICMHDRTPEHCGLAAAFELKKLLSVEHAPLECRQAKAADDPSLQICTFAHIDIARVLLEGGYVLTAADTSQDYLQAQESAHQGALGLWHNQYVKPEDWRSGKRLPVENDGPQESCPIKAVVRGNSMRLYFVPTDPDYEAIKIDPAKGDKLYCSDEDARRDGWRRYRQKN